MSDVAGMGPDAVEVRSDSECESGSEVEVVGYSPGPAACSGL